MTVEVIRFKLLLSSLECEVFAFVCIDIFEILDIFELNVNSLDLRLNILA